MMKNFSSRSGAAIAATTDNLPCIPDLKPFPHFYASTFIESCYTDIVWWKYQSLADKYAPAEDADIAKTLAQLQLAPDHLATAFDRAGTVPLPSRQQSRSKQQTAVAVRDGRRAVQGLADLDRRLVGSTTSSRSISRTSSHIRTSARPTSLSTVLEQDFTVPGTKSSLLCPFAVRPAPPNPAMDQQNSQGASTLESDRPLTPLDMRDPTPHHSSDPICAAMYAETMCSAPPSVAGSGAKCPIRYLDQHSPEEVAKYFESHKHEIPRSHEFCVKRYQRNESDIRKLDAKYGNLVSMIQGLGQKHQPMLSKEEDAVEVEHASDQRVEDWAKGVSVDGIKDEEEEAPDQDEDREGRFDRPMREVRVGESPSRPWGISVPIQDGPLPQTSGAPAGHPVSTEDKAKPVGKCPFGHDAKEADQRPSPHIERPPETERPSGKCPFPHEQMAKGAGSKPDASANPGQPSAQNQPVFIQPSEVPKMAAGGGGPQMVFTGPVFIGYPVEQAMALMQQWKAT
jgi:hypothetical protein